MEQRYSPSSILKEQVVYLGTWRLGWRCGEGARKPGGRLLTEMVGEGPCLGTSQRRHQKWIWKGGKCLCTFWPFFQHCILGNFSIVLPILGKTIFDCCINFHQMVISSFIILFLLFVCANWMYFWTVDGHRAIRIREVTDEQPPWTPHRFGLLWIMLLNLGFHVLTGILLTNDIVM